MVKTCDRPHLIARFIRERNMGKITTQKFCFRKTFPREFQQFFRRIHADYSAIFLLEERHEAPVATAEIEDFCTGRSSFKKPLQLCPRSLTRGIEIRSDGIVNFRKSGSSGSGGAEKHDSSSYSP